MRISDWSSDVCSSDLEAPEVIGKTLALIEKAENDVSSEAMTGVSDKIMRNPAYGLALAGMLEEMPPAAQIYYVTVLSRVKSGWTAEHRAQYFKWFDEAFGYQGGRSYVGFIDKSRQMARSEDGPVGKEGVKK